jgi:ABC-type antimicrobial peptide transport system permease subunit
MTNADRIIQLELFKTADGKSERAIMDTETNAFIEELKGKGFDYVALYNMQPINILVDEYIYMYGVGFVNADFWKIYDFKFLYGKPFSEEDCINRKPAIIITKKISLSIFNKANSIGEKITFQGNDYEVAGVVENVSMFSTPTKSGILVPYVFNKFTPNNTHFYILDVLMPASFPVNASKEHIFNSVHQYFENNGVKVDFPIQKIHTLKEDKAKETLGGSMFQYGSIIALFLFLLIPALNILSLSSANTNNRAEEIAVRRAFGAGRLSSFMLIMSENFLLTVFSALTGMASAIPIMSLIQQNLMSNSTMTGFSIIDHIDYIVIFVGILPMMLIFSLLSGGLPAYLISKRNITQVLKGGSK